MFRELILAGFITFLGISVAGAGTYLYQLVSREAAALRYDGRTLAHSFGHLLLSFVCGPFIMLQMSWRMDRSANLATGTAIIAAFVAFGWAFITGLIFLGSYFAVTGA